MTTIEARVGSNPTGSGDWQPVQIVAIGVIGGALSGLLGVGGGVIMVPLLVLWAGVNQRHAHAMSLGAIIPISVAGIVVYGNAGEVAWLDAVGLASGAIVGARLGTSWLGRIDERSLTIAFGGMLVLAAISLVVRI